MKNFKNQKGQALLIILLVMAVGLTIGLAVVSRSVTDIRISRQEEESARVFSVSEAGIEQALLQGPGNYPVGDITAVVTGGALLPSNEFDFGGGKFQAGEIQTVWLVGHDNNGNLTEIGRYTGNTIDLYWGNENQASNQPTTPALEVTVIYRDGSNYKIKRGAFDPYSGADPNRNANGFEDAEFAGYSVGGKTFQFRKTGFTLPTSPLIPYALRLRLLYNDQAQIMGVNGSSALPSQGTCYESTATAGSGVTRKVRQCQFYKAPLGIFDYVLYSEQDLVHQ